MEINDETWEDCLWNVQKCSVHTRNNLIQFQVVHRLHYLQERLHKFTLIPICNQCKSAIGAFAYTF